MKRFCHGGILLRFTIFYILSGAMGLAVLQRFFFFDFSVNTLRYHRKPNVRAYESKTEASFNALVPFAEKYYFTRHSFVFFFFIDKSINFLVKYCGTHIVQNQLNE